MRIDLPGCPDGSPIARFRFSRPEREGGREGRRERARARERASERARERDAEIALTPPTLLSPDSAAQCILQHAAQHAFSSKATQSDAYQGPSYRHQLRGTQCGRAQWLPQRCACHEAVYQEPGSSSLRPRSLPASPVSSTSPRPLPPSPTCQQPVATILTKSLEKTQAHTGAVRVRRASPTLPTACASSWTTASRKCPHAPTWRRP